MADKFYSLNLGATANPDNVVVANASTAGSDVEVRVELGNAAKTLDIAVILDAIKRRILDGRNQVLGDV